MPGAPSFWPSRGEGAPPAIQRRVGRRGRRGGRVDRVGPRRAARRRSGRRRGHGRCPRAPDHRAAHLPRRGGAHEQLADRCRRVRAAHLAVHAVRRHAARTPTRVHGGRATGSGRAALRARRRRRCAPWAWRSPPGDSAPRWRSTSRTTARSRSGSTRTSAERLGEQWPAGRGVPPGTTSVPTDEGKPAPTRLERAASPFSTRTAAIRGVPPPVGTLVDPSDGPRGGASPALDMQRPGATKATRSGSETVSRPGRRRVTGTT